MRHQFFRTYLITLQFLCVISFPFLNDRFHFITDIPGFENRKLAEKPVFNPEHLDPYPAAFEKYYNDTFALRSRIIRGFNLYNIVILKKTPFPDEVIIGKNNWLFLSGMHVNAYLGKDSFSEKELKSLKEILLQNEKYLASKNCKFYVMIVPTKANIYPENMPFTFCKLNELGWGEEINRYMDKNSDLKMIDLFTALKKEKSNDPLYYLADLHWNRLGAFYSANAAINKMSQNIPGLSPLALGDYRIVKKPLGIGDIRRMVGDLDMYNETEYELVPIAGSRSEEVKKENYMVNTGFVFPDEYARVREIKGSRQPKLLIFSDSFGMHIFPFLSENFSRTVKIFDGWSYAINTAIVEKEKPDIVLMVIYEPFIRNMLPKD
jgi:alginate O-acetyltransferase complex protein AlgJ